MTTRARTAPALFIFFQAFYALSSSGNAFRIPDEFELYFQAEHLFDAGDISVPQTLEIPLLPPRTFLISDIPRGLVPVAQGA